MRSCSKFRELQEDEGVGGREQGMGKWKWKAVVVVGALQVLQDSGFYDWKDELPDESGKMSNHLTWVSKDGQQQLIRETTALQPV